jgi:hypothetical protein
MSRKRPARARKNLPSIFGILENIAMHIADPHRVRGGCADYCAFSQAATAGIVAAV